MRDNPPSRAGSQLGKAALLPPNSVSMVFPFVKAGSLRAFEIPC